jgi:hypothetical protein
VAPIIVGLHNNECARTTTDGSGVFAQVPCTVPRDCTFKGQFDFVASGTSSIKTATRPFRVT